MVRVSKIAFGVRMMRAGINSIDIGALGRERPDNRVLYRFKFSPAIIASADPCLTGRVSA